MSDSKASFGPPGRTAGATYAPSFKVCPGFKVCLGIKVYLALCR